MNKNTERNLFLVVKNEFTDNKIKAHRKSHEEVFESWKAFTKKHSAEDNFYAGRYFMGILFKKDQNPEEWISKPKHPNGVYYPARRKACMEAYKEFSALKGQPDNLTLTGMLGLNPVFVAQKAYVASFEKIGDQIILSLHEDSEVPKGVTPLKKSEYWKLKEQIKLHKHAI